MSFVESKGLRYFQFDIFKDQHVFHAVFTRHGGFSQPPYETLNFGGTVGDDPSAVLNNHQKVYEVLGYDFLSRFDVWQVHDTKIVCANSPRLPGTPHEKADGILTDNPDLTMFMRFADCVPILLLDPIKKVIGIIHAGWQGTYKKIVKIAVEAMVTNYASEPNTLIAGIGPSICQKCYEVGPEVLSAFKESFDKQAENYFKQIGDRLFLDLWRSNEELLMDAGLNKIEISGLCTACNIDDWYSHRAENGKTGRFGVLMALKSE